MEYRNLGRTGVKVSELCLGCMMFGAGADEAQSKDMVDRAIDEGVNFFDTANVYSRGVSEDFLGKALKRNGKRDSVVIATKVHGAMADDDPNMRGNQRRHIIEQCEASLRRLQTDWIDLYQIHRPMSDIPIDETLRAMDDLVHAGKVRYLGTSTYAAWQLVEALWVAKEYGLNRFVCEQPPYHLLDRRIERELIPFAQSYGYALIPWSPLAGGFLTGKYGRGGKAPEGSRYSGESEWSKRHFTDAAFDVVDVVKQIAEEKACTPAQVALEWCTSQPGVTSSIIGPRNMAQLDDNLGSVEIEITDEDHQRLDKVAPPGGFIVSYYDADFGPSKYRW
jgi:aryl-alcohol dehydrogenase-like predicted oxidoreductase